jgi:anaerobic magnesium-protoporphyrin IX monomethyl ester cyclase
MRLVFLNPPFLPDYSRGQRSPAVTRSGTLYYPIWLAYGAAHAVRLGCEVDLIDAVASNLSEEAVLERVQSFAPDIVLIEAATPSISHDLAVADRLAMAISPTPVYLCGTHVSALPDEALAQAPQVTGVVRGEFEIPVEELILAQRHGHKPTNREGVHLRGQKTRERTRYFADLDARPFVSEMYARFLPIDRYFNPNAHHPMVMIVTGRGCPFHCSFCVFPQTLTGHRYRARSVDGIMAEFAWIHEHLPQVRGVFIEDDTFTADRERVREFARRLAAHPLPLSWTANARADVDGETLQWLRRSNVRGLCVGFESGSQALLDGINKGLTLATMERFAVAAQQAGVKVHGCFIVGLPGETRATMQETLQFALRLPLDTAQFYPLMVYPGTRGFRQATAARLVTAQSWRDWLTPEGQHRCVVRTADCSAEQLVRFCNLARRRFYLRKSYLWGLFKRVLTDPEERHRVMRSARTFLRHLFKDK